jgi:diacylglycerol O-acyltransferase / wax synthase
MAQPKPLDVAFQRIQDASLAIGAAAIVEGGAPGFDALKTFLAERLLRIPQFSQVLRTPSLDVTGAEWVDHPGFDLTHHLRRVTLPRPGDDTELFRAVARALERPISLDRPLWECWIIEGLEGNRWAILLKVHQRMADGISAAHILTRLCDDADADTFANHFSAEQDPPECGQRGWADALVRASAVAGTVNSALAGLLWPAGDGKPAAAPTRRRYSTVRVPIADVDRVCRRFGVTTNDVALAAITEGYRRVLLHRGLEPRADSLRTLVPASMRSAGATLPYLPVDHADPVQRLRTVHTGLSATRTAPRQSARIVESAVGMLPTVVRERAIRLLTGLPHLGLVTLATNVPGPRHRLRMLGRPMERVLPIPPTALQLSTGVAVLSYGDELVFGLTAEYDAARDLKRVAAGIQRELARLVSLSEDGVLLFTRRRRTRAHPHGALRGRPSAASRARR